jgi:hypothetical protein
MILQCTGSNALLPFHCFGVVMQNKVGGQERRLQVDFQSYTFCIVFTIYSKSKLLIMQGYVRKKSYQKIYLLFFRPLKYFKNQQYLF